MTMLILDPEVMEDARIATDHDIVKIEEWKSHILRAKNQNDCRYDLMESLEPHQMILVLDWAMKFLPLLFREKQEEFFGQKGLNWHVTVGIFRCEDGSLKVIIKPLGCSSKTYFGQINFPICMGATNTANSVKTRNLLICPYGCVLYHKIAFPCPMYVLLEQPYTIYNHILLVQIMSNDTN